jgi:hypothetical protein
VRTLAISAAALALVTADADAGTPQPRLIARISRVVFGPHARTAACVAHYESTDGAWLYNGPNLGPWQVSIAAHRWVDRRRVVVDWWYAARVAYVISARGRDWSPWAVHARCGA